MVFYTNYNNNRDLYDAFNASNAVASSNSFELKEIRHELDLRKARSRKELETAKDELENTKYIYHVRWGNNKLGSGLQDLKEDINRIADDNYYQYRYSPSPFIHGLLSSHSYQDSTAGQNVLFKEGMAVTLCNEVEEIQTKEEDKGWVDKILSIPSKMTGWFSKSKSEEESGHVNSKYNEYLDGWQVQKVFKPEGADDYYGVLYVNNEKGYAVLAHRGTAIDDSLKLKNESLKADLIEIFNGNMGVQQMHCNEATHKVVNLVKPYNYHLSTTGHSLGAWLAELSVYYCHESNYYKIKAITFDSPGTEKQFDRDKSSITNLNNSGVYKLPITTYLSAPNIVNSCNGHVGRVYHLYPKIKYPYKTDEITKQLRSVPYLGGLFKSNEHYVDVLLSVSGHALNPLIDCFDPETGNPKKDKCVEMKNWPKIIHENQKAATLDLKDMAAVAYLGRMILDLGTSPGLIKKAGILFKIKRTIKPDTYTEGYSVVKSFLKGATDLTQLFEVYNQTTNLKGDKDSVEIKDLFRLKYLGGYNVKDPVYCSTRKLHADFSKEISENCAYESMTNEAKPKSSTAWYLRQLHDSDENSMNVIIDDKELCKKLIDLKKKIEIKSSKEVKMLAPIEDIFCEIDDFCREFYQNETKYLLPNLNRKRNRYCRMSSSEIMTILVLFHLSHYRTFKDFYQECTIKYLKSYFPDLVSYNRFLELKSYVIPVLAVYMKYKAGTETGMYYIDSTTLKVCRNQRIHRHKVFDKIAKRGKSSMGWFFGFKLHLVINTRGEIMGLLSILLENGVCLSKIGMRLWLTF